MSYLNADMRMVHISEVCEDSSLSDAPILGPAPRTRITKRCGWVAGAVLLAAAPAALLLRSLPGRGAAASAGAPLRLQELLQDECEAYFRSEQDCHKRNLWGCGHDDGSVGWRCCCEQGFGEYGSTASEVTGMLSWSGRPELCVDSSTPFSLGKAAYRSGPFIVQACEWGDPNKQFRMPRNGEGQIRWAGHPELCMGVRKGRLWQGMPLALQNCSDAQRTGWIVDPAHKRIVWAADARQCLGASGDKDGSLLELSVCIPNEVRQEFEVVEAAELPVKKDYPRLFCLSLMLPFGSEPKLMKAQFDREIGIFECVDYAIYSNVTWTFTSGQRTVSTDIMNGSLAVQFGGKWHSALNTDIFIRFWKKVTTDLRAWRNHWTLKLDPDCVFFPSRLQQLAKSMWPDGDAQKPVFLNNCHLGMHGPIEALSRHALAVYSQRSHECVVGEPYTHKQEDFYLRRCWRMLGIEQVDVWNILFENAFACDERASTRDGRHPCFSKQVSFHPFKTPEEYWECYRRGASQTWAAPLMPLTEIPDKKNHHHG